jgi:hypothetical protein
MRTEEYDGKHFVTYNSPVFNAVNIMINFFWYMKPCSLAENCQCFSFFGRTFKPLFQPEV